MKLRLAGYELAPQEQFHANLMGYAQNLANGEAPGAPPTPGRAIFADQEGNHFLPVCMDDGVAALPFICGSPTDGDNGGFVPIEEMPDVGAGDGAVQMMGEIPKGLPAAGVADWLGAAAPAAMLGGAPGSALASALSTLGLANPMSRGVLGGAVAAAGNMAGMGRIGSLMGGAISGGSEGLANALGAQGLSGLVNATGLASVPGLGPAAGMLGGQLSNLANALTGDAWSQGLDQATGCLGDLLGGAVPSLDDLTTGGFAGPLGDAMDLQIKDEAGAMADNIVEGGCTNPGAKSSAFDPKAVATEALDQAADRLLDQWQVDDESSAAEHIAHKAVNDNKAAIKEAASDPSGFAKRISEFFGGKSSAASLPAARIGDPDITKSEVLSTGEANILVEGLPISRVSDKLAPSQSPVVDGAAMVLAAGLPTARATAPTMSPGVMIEKGAGSVLVGDLGSGDAAAAPPDAKASSNGGPAGPDSPAAPASGSGGGGGVGEGAGATEAGGDSTTGRTDPPEQGGAEPTSDKPASTAPAGAPTSSGTASASEGGMCEETTQAGMPGDAPPQSLEELISGPPQEGLPMSAEEVVVFNEVSAKAEGSQARKDDLDRHRGIGEDFANGRNAIYTTADSNEPLPQSVGKITIDGHRTGEDGPMRAPFYGGMLSRFGATRCRCVFGK